MNDVRIMRRPKRYARVYWDVNLDKNPDFFDYDNYYLEWQKPDDYQLCRKLGRGSFSDVFDAINVRKDKRCVLKMIKPVEMWLVRKEIKILRHLKNGPNIIALEGIAKAADPQPPALIFEHLNGIDLKQIILDHDLNDYDVRYYSYELLKALDYCHKMGIMHRDVKPSNIIVDLKARKLRLIDFGLSNFYLPGRRSNTTIGSRQFRAPELFLRYPYYDYAVDIWSFGCTLASMIFKLYPLFDGENDADMLISIVKVLGTDRIPWYVKKYDIDLAPFDKSIPKHCLRNMKQFVNDSNQHLVSFHATDLLEKILVYDHLHRLTAREAMDHPYFYLITK